MVSDCDGIDVAGPKYVDIFPKDGSHYLGAEDKGLGKVGSGIDILGDLGEVCFHREQTGHQVVNNIYSQPCGQKTGIFSFEERSLCCV